MIKRILFEGYDGPRLSREAQLRRLKRVIDQELTPTQREMMIAFYFENKTMTQISRERGVTRSSVCRTLQRAEARCRRSLRY